MECNNCKQSIADGTRFCPNCGNEVWNSGNTSLPDKGMVKAERKKIARLIVAVIVVIAVAVAILGITTYNSYYKATYGENVDITPLTDLIAAGEYFEMGIWRGEPIIWRVLEVKDGQALVITKDILRIQQYDGLEEYGERLADAADQEYTSGYQAENASWQDSDIRKWLNDDLFKSAFSKAETSFIRLSRISTPIYTYYDESKYHTGYMDELKQIGMTATEDYLFLLSYDEAIRYFIDFEDMIAHRIISQEDIDYEIQIYEEDIPSEYAQSHIEWLKSSYTARIGEISFGNWWLRFDTAANDAYLALHYSHSYFGKNLGYIYGGTSLFRPLGVRPAMWIDLR